jgi:predicted nucleic acid-binding protein
MKHFFLDTNIVLDVLLNREPFSEKALFLFESGFKGKSKLYLSALSYANIYYYLKKSSSSHEKAIFVLKEMELFIETVDVTRGMIHNSLNSDFKDFEDAIQDFCAQSVKIDAFVTRNPKDFKNSKLLILSPSEALALL